MSKEHAEIFRILSVESRIRIIELLKQKGRMGVNEIAEELGISPSAVSQHLKILKYAGLVKSERKGYWIPYELNPKALTQCREVVIKVCSCCCDDSCQPNRNEPKKVQEEIEMLKQYEKDLQDELAKVQNRINDLKKR